jgi:DNA repair exonuclease SbcCD ATPase subunit
LKERIDEFVSNEKHLIELNKELERQIEEYKYKSKRSESSSSSSSSSSNETVITTSNRTEQTQNLNKEVEQLKNNYSDLEEKYEFEKHELQTIIEQLREDIIDLDKTKQLYTSKYFFSFQSDFIFLLDICQEKNSIEDTLRSKFEFELKTQLDDFHRILEKEYNENILFYKNNQSKLEQDNQDLEQQSKEIHQEIDRIKITHEKQINELNNELDRLRTNGKNIYI